MADFCNKCAPLMWGDNAPVDIDIQKIYESLPPASYEVVLCEGCGLHAVGKTDEHDLLLALPVEDGGNDPIMTNIKWVSLDEFMKIKSHV